MQTRHELMKYLVVNGGDLKELERKDFIGDCEENRSIVYFDSINYHSDRIEWPNTNLDMIDHIKTSEKILGEGSVLIFGNISTEHARLGLSQKVLLDNVEYESRVVHGCFAIHKNHVDEYLSTSKSEENMGDLRDADYTQGGYAIFGYSWVWPECFIMQYPSGHDTLFGRDGSRHLVGVNKNHRNGGI